MENKKLVVFPGAGSPTNTLYSNVYGLIERGALKNGYDSVDLSVKWSGQIENDSETSESLNFHSALKTASDYVSEYEEAGLPYDILGRSFGTYVALKIVHILQPKLLGRLILWGVPPFWHMWELYVRDFDETFEIAKTKGVLISRDTFSSFEAIEPIMQKINYPVIIASGTKDTHSTEGDIKSFRASIGNKFVQFKEPVKDAPHEVTDKHPEALINEYFKALFQ